MDQIHLSQDRVVLLRIQNIQSLDIRPQIVSSG